MRALARHVTKAVHFSRPSVVRVAPVRFLSGNKPSKPFVSSGKATRRARTRQDTYAVGAATGEGAVLPPQPRERVQELFDRIKTGLAEMEAENEGFTVRRTSPDSLEINVGNGNIFTIELTEQNGLQMISPVHHRGGTFAYVYDEKQDGFVSAADNHSILECLSRDLVYIAKGYPKF